MCTMLRESRHAGIRVANRQIVLRGHEIFERKKRDVLCPHSKHNESPWQEAYNPTDTYIALFAQPQYA